jgi:hypothetical protein
MLPAEPPIHLEKPTTDADLRREAARLLGRVRSAAKTAAARRNAKRGGRPRGMRLSEETRRKISETKRRRPHRSR